MKKKVTRKWTKKSGEVVVKEYTYDYDKSVLTTKKKHSKMQNIITKTGRINKSAMKNALKELPENERVDFERAVKIYKMTGKKGLTVDRAIASFHHSRIEGMFVNCGYTLAGAVYELNEVIAEEGYYPMSVEYVLENANWDWNIPALRLPDGRLVKFDFVYGYNTSHGIWKLI